MKKFFLLSVFSAIVVCLSAQDPIQIAVATEHSSMVYKVGADGRLYQSYLGEKINQVSRDARLHEAYIPSGTDNLFEPAIRMVHADGNPSLVLKYSSHDSKTEDGNVTTTSIRLKDPMYAVEVVLHISAFAKEDIFKMWTEIINRETQAVKLTTFASAMLHVDAKDYWLTQFHGDWAKEANLTESKLTAGIKTIDSKLGARAAMYHSPFFFVSMDEPATETSGTMIAGTLAWTGNFELKFEVDERNSLRMIAGINPFASSFDLRPNQSFVTPEFIFTISTDGRGQASRNFHRWAGNYGILDGKQPRMTLLNNWETTFFDFDEPKLRALLDDASTLGVDLFLLDDGWFGNKYPRKDDRAGLGDWEPMRSRLPNGLSGLIKTGAEKGVKFGIWIEPEMVNEKSDLFEKHPDWILKLPNRPYPELRNIRNQFVLDLVNPKVQDFVFGIVDDLFSKNPGLAYIKWDCNSMMGNPWSPYLRNDQSMLFIEYTRGFYKVLDRIRAKYPHIPMMLCSGGGGRTDYGALKYFTEFWPSDDTEPVERIFIQWGYSNFFPSFAVCNHVTSWGKESLKFRVDVAMMGKMGFDLNIHHLTPKELAFGKQAVQEYKRISPVIWTGNLYRLESPYEGNRASALYVKGSRAILFSYNLHSRVREEFGPVRLQGLDPAKRYTIEEINQEPGSTSVFFKTGDEFSGDWLMKTGIDIAPVNELSSAVFEINEVTK